MNKKGGDMGKVLSVEEVQRLPRIHRIKSPNLLRRVAVDLLATAYSLRSNHEAMFNSLRSCQETLGHQQDQVNRMRNENIALRDSAASWEKIAKELSATIPMRLHCPSCGELHVDAGEFATKPHHTHACQTCGAVWRPAVVPTVGVRFLPGFKDETP